MFSVITYKLLEVKIWKFCFCLNNTIAATSKPRITCSARAIISVLHREFSNGFYFVSGSRDVIGTHIVIVQGSYRGERSSSIFSRNVLVSSKVVIILFKVSFVIRSGQVKTDKKLSKKSKFSCKWTIKQSEL